MRLHTTDLAARATTRIGNDNHSRAERLVAVPTVDEIKRAEDEVLRLQNMARRDCATPTVLQELRQASDHLQELRGRRVFFADKAAGHSDRLAALNERNKEFWGKENR